MPQIPDTPVVIAGIIASVEGVSQRDDQNRQTGVIGAYKVLLMSGATAFQVKIPADKFDVMPDAQQKVGAFVVWYVVGRAWKMNDGNHGVTYTYQNRATSDDLADLAERLDTAKELAAVGA